MMGSWNSPSKNDRPEVPKIIKSDASLNEVTKSVTPPQKQIPKKQVNLSWFVVLGIVLIPLVLVVLSLGWYMFWKTDVAYVEPESVVIRASDDMIIKTIVSEGDKVKVNDTLATVYLSGLEKWIEQTAQMARLSKTTVSQPYLPLGEYQRVISLASKQAKDMDLRYENLKKDANGYVTPKELLAAYQGVQESKIALHKAKIDLDVARLQNRRTTTVNLDDEFIGMRNRLNSIIMTPISGTVVKRLVNANEQVVKGQEILHIAGVHNFFIDLHLKAPDVIKKPIGSECYVWFPDGSKIVTHITNYIKSDSNGVVIARMKPDSKIDDQFMIPGLPVNTRCK